MSSLPEKTIHNESFWMLEKDETHPAYILVSTGITFADSTYHIHRPQGVDFYTIEYVLSGTGMLKVGDEVYHPVANDVWILPPNLPVDYYSDEQHPWEKIWFNIGGELPEALIAIYALQGCYLFNDCKTVQEYFKRGLNAVREQHPSAANELAINLHSIIAGLAKEHHANKEEHSLASELKAFCKANWRKNIRLEQLARQIHHSKVQTLRIFKQSYGITPAEWITQYRLAYAKQYLLNTNNTLLNIAEAVGFKDEYYFANWFKRNTGEAPGRFRRKNH